MNFSLPHININKHELFNLISQITIDITPHLSPASCSVTKKCRIKTLDLYVFSYYNGQIYDNNVTEDLSISTKTINIYTK